MKTWEKILIGLFFVWVLFWFAVLRPSIMAKRSAMTVTNRFDCVVTNPTGYTVFSNCVIIWPR